MAAVPDGHSPIAEANPARPARLPSLTGLRFAAAALVFAYHGLFELRFVSGDGGAFLAGVLSRGGAYGVGFFFVLSGFVLAWSRVPGRPATVFLRGRAAKIFPAHVVTFLAAVAVAVTSGTAVRAATWVPGLLLLQAWPPDRSVVTAGNAVSWSLSCELVFYLAFPVLARLIDRIPGRWLWVATGVVIVVCAMVAVAGRFAVTDRPRLTEPGFTWMSFTQIWFVYFFPPARLPEFVLGILLARLVRDGRWPSVGLLPATAVAALGYLVATWSPYLFGVGGLASVWLAPLIASAARADLRGTSSPFRGRAWIRLGELSFAFYLVHYLVLTRLRAVMGPSWTAPVPVELLVLALGCTAALVFAWLVHVLVERPAMRWVSRRGSTGGTR